MSTVIPVRWRVRRRTAASWASLNEVLLDSEPGLESDTKRGKIGDGVTAWNDLPYSWIGEVDLTGLAHGDTLLWDAGEELWVVGSVAGGSPNSATMIASEAMQAGCIVNVWNDAGVGKARKATASVAGREAWGFIAADVDANDPVDVCFRGQNQALAGMTPGAKQYLSATAGEVSESYVDTVGFIHQELGGAYSATAMHFSPQPAVTLVAPTP